MKDKSINKISKGAVFKIEKFLLNRIQKIKLMELGILPEIKMKLMQKNCFGSVVIKCGDNKYALDNSIAKKLIAK